MKVPFLPILSFLLVATCWQPTLVLAQEDEDPSSEYDNSDDETYDETGGETDEGTEVFTREDIVSNPAQFGLYSKAQFNANFTAGLNAGRKVGQQEVIKNPTAYGLLSKADVPVVRLSARPGTAFTISLPGSWRRFAQSGMPPIRGWQFNRTTGVLSGFVPSRGNASIRLTPYKVNNQVGAQITLDLRPAAR